MNRQFILVLGLFILLVAAGCDGDGGSDGGVDTQGAADTVSGVDHVTGDDAPLSPDQVSPDLLSGDDVVAPDDVPTATDVPETDDVAADTGEPPVDPPYLDMPIAACGMPAYELIDPAELGELLMWEPIPMWDVNAATLNALLATTGRTTFEFPYGVTLFRMRYTTQDRGERVEATAIIGIPKGEGILDDPLPIALSTHGTTGFVDECAPSHPDFGMEGPALSGLFSAMGYVTVAPDYIGMNGFGEPSSVRHAYLVGEQAAIGSWDAVRAARTMLAQEIATPVETLPTVIPWGASQGGHAALFVEHYAPYYAPEFEVPAVVALIAPFDLLPVWQYSATAITESSGLFTVSLATMYEWYGQQSSLDMMLTNEEPYFIADNVVEAVYPEGRCKIEGTPEVSEADEAFTASSIELIAAGDWEALQPWSCYYSQNSLGTSNVPPLRFTPTLTIFGEDDVLVRPPEIQASFLELCERGWRFEYIECAETGHTDAALETLLEQFEWVADRLAGEPIPAERLCTITEPRSCSLDEATE